jgi:signal transduction histidine kinase/CheY-like chemotaxis protein
MFRMKWFAAHGPALMSGLLGCVALASIYLGLANQHALERISHTSQVQRSVSELSSALVDAIKTEGIFLLTQPEGALAQWTSIHDAINVQLAATSRLVSDNPEQVDRVGELKRLIDDRFTIGAGLLAAPQLVVGAAPVASAMLQRETQATALLRSQIKVINSVETALFDRRTAEAVVALRALMVAAGLGCLTVAAALLIWWRETQGAITILASANSKLTDSLIEQRKTDGENRQLQKMEAIGQLTGGLAHDFNNMLAVVISSLTLAQKRLAKGPANIDSLIAGALDGAQRAATLTSRLLAFSRQQPLSPKTLNLNRIVGGMSEMITRTIGEAVKVETVLAGGLWTTHVDVSQMENALLNLCVNARDAMDGNGLLTVETSNAHLDDNYARSNPGARPGQYVLIAVTDTGAGMTPEVAAAAFDPFFTTKGVGKGSGLGLSQVFGFVKQSGGHLKIYSEVGQGTTIKIYLPRTFETVVDVEAANTLSRSENRDMARGDSQILILVVEDESLVRRLTVLTLRELGYTVLHAEDAIAALKLIDTHQGIDLMFTDIVMPGMNGRLLADAAVLKRPDLKVLFTTGFTRNAVVHGGVLDAGVNFITKPFTIEQLAAKVSAVLQAPKLAV